MNNLKKVLALGLALVMLLGMFTIVSAADAKDATQLTDWDKITHQNAVALNVDLGIIEGMPDGSYSPEANIDRASWAKLVYVAKNGDDDAEVYENASNQLSDVAGNWAAGYINYLFANEFISGDGTGHYNPDNNVTVVEACKTMLTILGYDSKDRGYEGSAAWDGKVMSDAKANGLMKSVTNQKSNAALTRDDAAQIIYNALAARTVEKNKTYDQGNQYVSSYTYKNTLGYQVFDLIKLSGVVSEVNDKGYATFVTDADAAGRLMADKKAPANGNKVNGEVKASLADVGQYCDVFVKGEVNYNFTDGYIDEIISVDELVSTTVSRSTISPLATVTNGVKFDDQDKERIWTRGDDMYVGAQPEKDANGNPAYGTGATETLVSCYINGKPNTTTTEWVARQGDVAELYDIDENGKVDTIKIMRYNVAEINGTVRTKVEAGEDCVLIPNVTKGKYVPVAQVSGNWQDLTDGDVVLFYSNGETDGNKMVLVLEKAESVTGKVTAKAAGATGKSTITLGGKTYKCSGINNEPYDVDIKNTFDYENEFTVYLDKNGGICYSVQNTDETVTGNVAVVLDSKWITSDYIGSTEYLQAKLLFLDGSTKIVRVNKIGVGINSITMKTVVGDEARATANSDRMIYCNDSVALNEAGTKTFPLVGTTYEDGFFSYRVDSNGYYELTNLSQSAKNWDAVIDLEGHNSDGLTGIEKRPKYAANDTANSKTIFLVAKFDENTNEDVYSTYTGYANVSAITYGNFDGGVAIHDKDRTDNSSVNGSAKYVFLHAQALADDIPEGFIFLRNRTSNEDVDGNYTLNIVDAQGNETTMKFEYDADTLFYDSNDKLAVVSLYAISDINDGVVGKVTRVSEGAIDNAHYGNLTGIGDGVVSLEANGVRSAYEYDDKTVMVLIDLKEDPENLNSGRYAYDTVSELDPENLDTATDVYDHVWVGLVEQDGLCDYIYVVRGVHLSQNG